MSQDTREPPIWRGPALWRSLAGWCCALLLCAWLYRHVQDVDWKVWLAQVPWGWWPVAVVTWMAGYGVRARRLQQEWAHRCAVPWRRCLVLVLRHNAAVLLLPLRLGEAGYLVSVTRQWGVPVKEAAWSLLRLRLQDALVLGLLAITWLVPSGMWLAGGVVLLLFALRRKALRALPMPTKSGRHLWFWLGQLLTAAGWGHSVLNWTLRLAVIAGWLLLLTPAAPPLAIGAALGAEMGSLWPLQGPAGLGPFELGAWTAARWLGGVPPGWLAAALSAHLFCVAVALSAAALTFTVRSTSCAAVAPLSR